MKSRAPNVRGSTSYQSARACGFGGGKGRACCKYMHIVRLCVRAECQVCGGMGGVGRACCKYMHIDHVVRPHSSVSTDQDRLVDRSLLTPQT